MACLWKKGSDFLRYDRVVYAGGEELCDLGYERVFMFALVDCVGLLTNFRSSAYEREATHGSDQACHSFSTSFRSMILDRSEEG